MNTSSRFSAVSRRAFLGGMSATAILGLAACSSDDETTGTTGGSTSGSTGSSGSSGTSGAAVAEISFTFAGSSGGRTKNPYIAVWIEDSSGALVQTVSLWHLQQNDRWLNSLTRWAQVSGGTETNSSGTRAAGTYTVSWDGNDANGSKVSAGDYYVCVESAVEHGNYSLVREQVTLGDSSMEKTLADNGDLSGVSIKYTP